MRRMGLWSLLVWLGLVLACNAPFSEPALPEPPTPAGNDNTGSTPTDTPTPQVDDDIVPTATEESVPSETVTVPAAATEVSSTPLPTFTPIQQPTLANTLVPTETATPRPTTSSGPNPTATTGSSGPLSVEYNVSWVLDPADPFNAIATVTLTATGGNGVYTYYHDEQPVSGPVFSYNWGACRGNPGSFRVDSGDGQSVKIDYFENPPCPTPTPSS